MPSLWFDPDIDSVLNDEPIKCYKAIRLNYGAPGGSGGPGRDPPVRLLALLPSLLASRSYFPCFLVFNWQICVTWIKTGLSLVETFALLAIREGWLKIGIIHYVGYLRTIKKSGSK